MWVDLLVCADSRIARPATCLGRPILKYRPIPSCNRSSSVHEYLRLWIRSNPFRLAPSEKPSGLAELVGAENRDTVPYQRLWSHTADRPRSRRPAPAQHDLPLWPSDSRT